MLLAVMMAVSMLTLGAFADDGALNFTDVRSDSPYAEAVEALAAAGIMVGVGGSRFAPDMVVSRSMAITVLGRAANAEPEDTDMFSDVDNGSWYSGYVSWAYENGIIIGDGEGRFYPNNPVTAGQMDLIMTRFAKLAGVVYTAGSSSPKAVTRGELAQIIYEAVCVQTEANIALYIEGYEWGPCVTKVIVTLPEAVDAVSSESAVVTTKGVDRMVEKAYLSDAEGREVTEASEYVTLELDLNYAVLSASSPFDNPTFFHNYWTPNYHVFTQFTVEQNGEDKTVVMSGNCIDNRIAPDADQFAVRDSYTHSDGEKVQYAAYEPEDLANDGVKNPLIIWLHGAGEGGDGDPTTMEGELDIALLGNEAADLANPEIQKYFTTEGGAGGAYVLVPQCETMWMDVGDGQQGDGAGISRYTAALMGAIDQYLAGNSDVDVNRIYIGGCSNGGYMTVNMMIRYPDRWAAAYPICEAYQYSIVTAEDVETIKDIPTWFVHCANDFVVNPSVMSMPLYRAMLRAGAENAWFSLYENVLGMDLDNEGVGFPHAIWQHVFNDAVKGVQNVDAIKNSADDDETMGFVASDATNGGDSSNGYDSIFAWMNDQVNDLTVANGSQTAVIEGFDWGPAVTKVILDLDVVVAADSVTAGSFSVSESKQSFNWFTFSPAVATAARTVTDAYVSDAEGNRITEDSNYVTLELFFDPNNGSPYFYDFIGSGQNTLADPYDLAYALTGKNTLTTVGGDPIYALSIAPVDLTAALTPQLDVEGLDLSGVFTGSDGKVLQYGSYAPADDGEKHPLVIWLHGMGEGGTDASIPVLGNKVTPLYGEEFQSIMGGAYILTPQTAGFWLQYDEEDLSVWGDNPGTASIYTKTLKELIDKYVADNEDIDPDRIIIGGCSNGGYMTMNMILEYPDFFVAAYPICEAYLDAGITDEQLESIKDLPIWFVYAENDTTVDPTVYEAPTIARLEAIGADVHSSVFPNVVDTSGLYTNADGTAYEYMGHWSWIYFFNNECEEDGVNMWEWMAEQSK